MIVILVLKDQFKFIIIVFDQIISFRSELFQIFNPQIICLVAVEYLLIHFLIFKSLLLSILELFNFVFQAHVLSFVLLKVFLVKFKFILKKLIFYFLIVKELIKI